ncbi:MAG: hypothetical protein WCP36_05365, partial [Methanomicrobiales archaeon]
DDPPGQNHGVPFPEKSISGLCLPGRCKVPAVMLLSNLQVNQIRDSLQDAADYKTVVCAVV